MVNIKKILGQCYIWLILFLMYLPVLVLVAFSFSASEEISSNYGQPTIQLYVDLFTGPNSGKIFTAVGNTVLIALISSVVSVFLGTLGAIGSFYSKKRMRKAYDFVTQIPVVNAEIVLAFSLTVLFVFLGTYVFKQYLFSFWTLLIGHVVLSIPFVYISVKPKLQQMDPSLYEAAIDLGATPQVALRKVTLPAILPGILSGFLLSITLSLDDFVITAFTRGAGLLSGEGTIETLSTYVQGKIKKTSIPVELRALTTILLVLVILAVVFISIRRYYLETHKKVRRF